MKHLALPIGVFILAVIAGIAVMVLPGKQPVAQNNQQATTTPQQNNGGNEGDTIAGIPDLIMVGAPNIGDEVGSPITITGSARGTWYFEASFPLELRDASGKVIAQHYAEAQSNWMTEDFVIFKATLEYPAQPAGSKGVLVLKKDNPSGDPARDRSVEIPVVFK